MKLGFRRDRGNKSRRPLPPEPDAVEHQYGDDADLYAEVRAGTAAALGREKAAQEWEDVKVEIEKTGEENQIPNED